MKSIEGILTDKVVESYLALNTYGYLGFWYSSDIHNGTNLRLFIKEIPPFDEVYANFMSHKICFLKFNKQQDMCLSLFYNPYFKEFYDRVKADIGRISKNRLKFLKKYLLTYLADPIQFNAVLDYNMSDKTYYIEHGIYDKSKELLQLINNQ